VARGYDVTRYTLQCFGGAGGQHACLVADALGMTRVLVHPLAGVLSAYGMGLADQNVIREQAVEATLTEAAMVGIAQQLQALAASASAELQRQAVNAGALHVHQRVHVRYLGSDAALIVPFGSTAQIEAAFEAAYRQRFAFLMHGKSLVVEAVSVEAVVAGDAGVRAGELAAVATAQAEGGLRVVAAPSRVQLRLEVVVGRRVRAGSGRAAGAGEARCRAGEVRRRHEAA
jgi:5-oxoprolinase (ATP-hydrolysing)